MNNKLDKLDSIERHLARVEQDIKDLKQSYTFVNETANELKHSQKLQNESITTMKEKVTKVEDQNTRSCQEIIYIRAHSMRSNLVFYNLPEVEEEDPFATVRDVLTNKM